MLKTAKRIAAAVMLLALMLTASGCFAKSPEELYRLPELSEEYLNLQEMIDDVLAQGAEYSAPTSGENRSAVQLHDLDGNGGEAVAFFNFRGQDEPLRIYNFRHDGREYVKAAVIEGNGSSFRSIDYVDFNGDGCMEIVVGWQLSSGMSMLSVYSVRDFQPAELISTDYTDYTVASLGSSGGKSLAAARLASSELTGEVVLYTFLADGEVQSSSARMSNGVEALGSLRVGRITETVNGIFAESIINGTSLVTDIFVAKQGNIENITADELSGISESTLRSYQMYARDINGDGVLEVPRPVTLPSQLEFTVYYAIEWYNFSASGDASLGVTTYHNTSDGWYLTVPSEWHGRFTVRREDAVSGERAIIFSLMGESISDLTDVLAVYTLSGDNKEERARIGDRFIISTEGSKIYAAEILLGAEISADAVRERFGLIYTELR